MGISKPSVDGHQTWLVDDDARPKRKALSAEDVQDIHLIWIVPKGMSHKECATTRQRQHHPQSIASVIATIFS